MNTRLASGPGVWTLRDEKDKGALDVVAEEEEEEEEAEDRGGAAVSRDDLDLSRAAPTETHLALVALWRAGFVRHVISQNIDGLHHRAGLPRSNLSELHGNVFVDRCGRCGTETVRETLVQHQRLADVPTLKRDAAKDCSFCSTPCFCHCTKRVFCEACGDEGPPLRDTIVNFGEELDRATLDKAVAEAKCSLCLVLGSSCRVAPAADLPREAAKHAVVNLQATPLDATADVRVGAPCDEVLARLVALLGVPDLEAK